MPDEGGGLTEEIKDEIKTEEQDGNVGRWVFHSFVTSWLRVHFWILYFFNYAAGLV
jgi:hypothetical protein